MKPTIFGVLLFRGKFAALYFRANEGIWFIFRHQVVRKLLS
jgi:hypothetical protein